MEVYTRSESELELMRRSGKITASALKKTLAAVKDGVNLLELEEIAENEILKLGGQPSFKTVPGYNWTTCLTLNNEVVHGIPRDIVVKNGDILSIDLGAVYKGWHTDAAWSVLVGNELLGMNQKEDESRFLKTGEEALWKGIKQAVEGKKIGDIAGEIQNTVEKKGGYKVVRALVGHGVGKELHEDPEVPGFGKKGTGLVLKAGMTIAIEVIYTMGSKEVVLERDGWTIVSEDGSLGGLFEMSVVVGKKKAEILTDWRKN